MQITITLTDEQVQALTYNHIDFEFYLNSITVGQVGVAVDEVSKICIEKCLETGTQIPSSKTDMVALAFANGWVKTAVDRQLAAPVMAAE